MRPRNYVRGAKIVNTTNRSLCFKMKCGYHGKPWIYETIEIRPKEHYFLHKGYFDGLHHSIAPVRRIHVYEMDAEGRDSSHCGRPILSIRERKKKEGVCLKVYSVVMQDSENTMANNNGSGCQKRNQGLQFHSRHMNEQERKDYYKFESRVVPVFVDDEEKGKKGIRDRFASWHRFLTRTISPV